MHRHDAQSTVLFPTKKRLDLKPLHLKFGKCLFDRKEIRSEVDACRPDYWRHFRNEMFYRMLTHTKKILQNFSF